MRKSLYLLATLALLPAIPIQPLQGHEPDPEYAVYSAIVSSEHQADTPKTLVILRTTSPNRLILPGSDDQKDILTDLAPLTEETLKSYNSRNTVEAELENSFDVTARVALVDQKAIDELFSPQKPGSWQAFYERYPDSGGFITVSRVGFDASASQALAFVAHRCGSLCASGTYFFLVRTNGKWSIAKSRLMWVS